MVTAAAVLAVTATPRTTLLAMLLISSDDINKMNINVVVSSFVVLKLIYLQTTTPMASLVGVGERERESSSSSSSGRSCCCDVNRSCQ